MFEDRFVYYAPTEDKTARYADIRNAAKALAELIGRNCPDTRERATSITKIEEAVMWANASIARN